MEKSINRTISNNLSRIGISAKAPFNKIAIGLEKLIKEKNISILFSEERDDEFFDNVVTVGNILKYYGISRFASLYSAYVDILQYEYVSDKDIAIKNATKVKLFPSVVSKKMKLKVMTAFPFSSKEISYALNLESPVYDIESETIKYIKETLRVNIDMNTGKISSYQNAEEHLKAHVFKKMLKESIHADISLFGKDKDFRGSKLGSALPVMKGSISIENLIHFREKFIEDQTFLPVYISGVGTEGQTIEIPAFLNYKNGEVLKPYGLTTHASSLYDTLHSCSVFINSHHMNIHKHIQLDETFSKVSQKDLNKMLPSALVEEDGICIESLKTRAFRKLALSRFKYDPIGDTLKKDEEIKLKSIMYDFGKKSVSEDSIKELISSTKKLYDNQQFSLVDAVIYNYRCLKVRSEQIIPKNSFFWTYETARDYPYRVEEKRIKNFFVWSKIIEDQGSVASINNSLEFNEEFDYFNLPESERILTYLPFHKIKDYPQEALGGFLYMGLDFSVSSNDIIDITKVGAYKIRNISEILNSYLLDHTFEFNMHMTEGRARVGFTIKEQKRKISA